MGWAVLLVWGKSEDNLKPGVISGEYLILRMWTEAAKLELYADHAFIDRFETLVTLYIQALVDYFEKVMPTLESPRAVLRWRRIASSTWSLCLRSWDACPPSYYCSSKNLERRRFARRSATPSFI